MEDQSISLEMLKSEEGQLNAVFACYGSAAQHAQFFEEALGEFLRVYNRLCNKTLKIVDFETLDEKLQRKTLGTLLHDFKKLVTINNDKVAGSLDTALKKRNFLMHHFFRERQKKFSSEQGRMEMLVELVSIDKELIRAMELTGGMRVALCEALSDKNKSKNAENDRGDPDEKTLFTIEIKIPDEFENLDKA